MNKKLKNLKESILKEIQEKEITPKSRLRFKVGNFGLWGLSLLTILAGSIATSAIFFVLLHTEWEIFRFISENPTIKIFYSIPFLWVGLFILFLLLANIEIKKTRYGYRYPLLKLFAILFIISLFGGSALYAAGIGKHTDILAEKAMPMYKSMETRQAEKWQKPGDGMVLGEIIEKQGTSIILRDKHGKIWTIGISKLGPASLHVLDNSKHVRIVGEKPDGDFCEACAVFPAPPKDAIDKFERMKKYQKNISERLFQELRNNDCEEAMKLPPRRRQKINIEHNTLPGSVIKYRPQPQKQRILQTIN